MTHYLYLAGPITGLSYAGCTDWRNHIAKALNSENVKCLSPMRGKKFLLGENSINALGYKDAIANGKGITRRDMFDCTRASCIFVNLLGAKKVSIGTCMEIAWAYQCQIPSIVIMEKDNPHQHVMVVEAATYVVDTLEEGVELAKFLLEG